MRCLRLWHCYASSALPQAELALGCELAPTSLPRWALALQNQAQALQTRTPLSRDEALRNLQGLTPSAQMQLNVQGDRVSVQLKAMPAPTLANWLAQARSQAQALPVEAHLTRGNTTGANSAVVWDGSLVLSLPNRGALAR